MLADSDHVSAAVWAACDARQIELLAAVPDDLQTAVRQAPTTRAWIARMASPAARDAYRGRKALSECVNAHVVGRFGLRRMPVRGLAKVTCVALLAAVVLNVLQHSATLARPPPAPEVFR